MDLYFFLVYEVRNPDIRPEKVIMVVSKPLAVCNERCLTSE